MATQSGTWCSGSRKEYFCASQNLTSSYAHPQCIRRIMGGEHAFLGTLDVNFERSGGVKGEYPPTHSLMMQEGPPPPEVMPTSESFCPPLFSFVNQPQLQLLSKASISIVYFPPMVAFLLPKNLRCCQVQISDTFNFFRLFWMLLVLCSAFQRG